jgi:hypothetical protein
MKTMISFPWKIFRKMRNRISLIKYGETGREQDSWRQGKDLLLHRVM